MTPWAEDIHKDDVWLSSYIAEVNVQLPSPNWNYVVERQLICAITTAVLHSQYLKWKREKNSKMQLSCQQ